MRRNGAQPQAAGPEDATERRRRHPSLLPDHFTEHGGASEERRPGADCVQRLVKLKTRSSKIVTRDRLRRRYFSRTRDAAEPAGYEDDEFVLRWRSVSGSAHLARRRLGQRWPKHSRVAERLDGPGEPEKRDGLCALVVQVVVGVLGAANRRTSFWATR